jgi:hypothetical protein
MISLLVNRIANSANYRSIRDLAKGVFQMSWRAGLTRPMINQRAIKQRRINPAYGRCTVAACRFSPVHRASFLAWTFTSKRSDRAFN